MDKAGEGDDDRGGRCRVSIREWVPPAPSRRRGWSRKRLGIPRKVNYE